MDDNVQKNGIEIHGTTNGSDPFTQPSTGQASYSSTTIIDPMATSLSTKCPPGSIRIADQEKLVIPEKKGTRVYRWLRWNFGSVYRRIFAVVFMANLIVLITLAVLSGIKASNKLTYDACATATATNVLVSLIARNEHFVNAIFVIFGSLPKKAPLRLRRILAKVYSYGGVHSGCNTAATAWFLAFTIIITLNYMAVALSPLRKSILVITYAIIGLLLTILVFAHPRLRALWHNWFENTHRFLGWTIILLLWTLILTLAKDTADHQNITMGIAVIKIPSFWILIYATLLVVYPWTNLRLREVEARVLSSHAIELKFRHTDVQYGQAVRLSDAPLRETHAFAVIPNMGPSSGSANASGASSLSDLERGTKSANISKGFSVIISNAGDWTKKIIQNPPKKVWVRGLPQYGVIRIAGLFKPVVIIATGSGIGPCLSLFVQAPNHPVRILWSARNPRETYGQDIIDTVQKADPQAVIIDTNTSGRLDLTSLAYNIYERGFSSEDYADGPTRCEAVVIISNQRVTQKVVYGLESRGVPAYGAIFDS